jgi:metal-responsive CopG/Arc/MetJ family transcriptional regulator
MKTIQVVLDEDTLAAADLQARAAKVNRSELIRTALRSYLRTTGRRAAESRHRAGYQRIPESADDLAAWDRVQKWPGR